MKKTLLDYALRIRLPIVLFVAVTASVATYFISRAERDGIGYAPEQPIAFSHKLHAGTMNIDCRYCHTGTEISAHATVPSAGICMNCHSVARKNKPEIVRLTQYYADSAALPWKRVHRVPDYAYFSHASHVGRGFDCSTCHGDVENMDVLMQVSEFTMSACLHCHRTAPAGFPDLKNLNAGPIYCSACHR